VWESFNRYGYSPAGPLIPYALACFFTAVTVVIGIITLIRHGVMPDIKFQDILSAADTNIITIARDPDSKDHRLRVDFDDGIPTLRAHQQPLLDPV
jgi:hypothetical protein